MDNDISPKQQHRIFKLYVMIKIKWSIVSLQLNYNNILINVTPYPCDYHSKCPVEMQIPAFVTTNLMHCKTLCKQNGCNSPRRNCKACCTHFNKQCETLPAGALYEVVLEMNNSTRKALLLRRNLQ